MFLSKLPSAWLMVKHRATQPKLLFTCLPQAQTYYSSGSAEEQVIREIDLACSVIFALEWAFRLWVAHDRLRYLFSAQSMVDIITCIPVFLSYIFGPVSEPFTRIQYSSLLSNLHLTVTSYLRSCIIRPGIRRPKMQGR
jgi:hypothetical protein